jgi:hypothetical protein
MVSASYGLQGASADFKTKDIMTLVLFLIAVIVAIILVIKWQAQQAAASITQPVQDAISSVSDAISGTAGAVTGGLGGIQTAFDNTFRQKTVPELQEQVDRNYAYGVVSLAKKLNESDLTNYYTGDTVVHTDTGLDIIYTEEYKAHPVSSALVVDKLGYGGY